ncbi:MAG TPA: arsenate reductase (glutaredoxin) [Candidatus Kapabacteria bacterium]|nr:arsenate reductase (glutaredoxin) [Candidatus Kapabacteria bacterium]
MYTIYHNPRCSKSREALALLEEAGVSVTVVRYLETPLDADALRQLLSRLGLPARDLLRSKEEEFASLGLGDPALTDDDLIAALVSHPRLMERPVVVHGRRAVIARPPERVKELLK